MLIVGGGILILIWLLRGSRIDLRKNRVFLLFILVIVLGIFFSYIPQFGMKQNRFAIYLYIPLAYLLICFLKGLEKSKYKTYVVPVFLGLFLITATVNIMDYNGYFPINEDNMDYLKSQTDLISHYDEIYAGGTAETMLLYLGIRNNVTSVIDDYRDIPDLLDGPLILMAEDVALYEKKYPEIYQRFLRLAELNYPIFDESSGSWIVLPG
jgi:hypothetical protein